MPPYAIQTSIRCLRSMSLRSVSPRPTLLMTSSTLRWAFCVQHPIPRTPSDEESKSMGIMQKSRTLSRSRLPAMLTKMFAPLS